MKTRTTTIRKAYPFYETRKENMTEAEISAYTRKCQETIHKSFKWEYYPASYTHLVVCVRYDGTACNIYEDGLIMTDKEFEETIANRKDLKIESCLAYHRGTAKF